MSAAGGTTRVVVTAAGRDAGAAVDPRFGRAPWLLLVDPASGRVEQAVDNGAAAAAAQGAGIRAAETVARLGAAALITGHCGPKAFRALQAAGVAVFNEATGSVAEAVAAYRDGHLAAASEADVAGHW